MFKELDPILHSQLRLAIVSLLRQESEAEFNWLKERTNASAGNLSVQLSKLREAGYIEVQKEFRNNYPLTVCRITNTGNDAFGQYVENLQSYLGSNGKEA